MFTFDHKIFKWFVYCQYNYK